MDISLKRLLPGEQLIQYGCTPGWVTLSRTKDGIYIVRMKGEKNAVTFLYMFIFISSGNSGRWRVANTFWGQYLEIQNHRYSVRGFVTRGCKRNSIRFDLNLVLHSIHGVATLGAKSKLGMV